MLCSGAFQARSYVMSPFWMQKVLLISAQASGSLGLTGCDWLQVTETCEEETKKLVGRASPALAKAKIQVPSLKQLPEG